MNTVGRKRRCNRSLITDRPEKPTLAESAQPALTVALKSAVTMRRGGPTLVPGAGRHTGGPCRDAPPRPDDRTAARSRHPLVEDRVGGDRPATSHGIRLPAMAIRRPGQSRRYPARNSAGRWRTARSGEAAPTRQCSRSVPGKTAPRNLHTAQRAVAVRSRCGRIETNERDCEASASTPRDGIPSAAPLTTRCELPHPVPKSTASRPVQSALAPIRIGLGRIKPQSRRRPPSPTPASPPTASLYRA
jgi:hypothetical protein